jgi:hypothetical protein
VRRAWKGRDDYRHIGEPKTRSSIRTVALPSVAIEAIARPRSLQADQRRESSWPKDCAGLVSTSAAGTPIDPSNYRRLV